MVQCSKCGAPVTFLGTRIRDNQMNQLEEVVNEMKRTVGEMADRLGGLDQRLDAAARKYDWPPNKSITIVGNGGEPFTCVARLAFSVMRRRAELVRPMDPPFPQSEARSAP